jgi:hypothetical protein
MKEVTGLEGPELVFWLSTMLSFPHARSAPLPQGSRTHNIYIDDEESFLATAAGHTVDAWSWVKSKDSSWYKNPRVMKYRVRSFNFQRLSFVAKCWYFRQKLRLWRAGSQSCGFFPHRILQASWHWAEFWLFSLFPQPSFTKTLIYLTLLNNSAWTEKANKGDLPTGRFGAVPPPLQGQWKQTLPSLLQPRIYRRKEICPQFPPTYLPF